MQSLLVYLSRYSNICYVLREKYEKPITLGDYNYDNYAYCDSITGCARYRIDTLGC